MNHSRRTFIGLALAALALPALATRIKQTDIRELVAGADHVVVGRVTSVDMVDGEGKVVTDPAAHTGPGLPNTLRYHVEVTETLKTSAPAVPSTLVLPRWPMWHNELGSFREYMVGKTQIFLLSGEDFHPSSSAEFERHVAERPEILAAIREAK